MSEQYLERRHPIIAQLISIRIEQGLSQKKLAEQSGLNRNTIITLESGKRNPSLQMLSCYCLALGYVLGLRPVVMEISHADS